MTLEDLQALINRADKVAMMAALDGVDAAARPKLGKAALKQAKELGTKIFTGEPSEGEPCLQGMELWNHRADRIFCCWLATYRLGAWEDIQKLERNDALGLNGERFTELVELLLPIFEREPPTWIEQWVTFLLDKRDYFLWTWIRRLMKAGVVGRPSTDNYILKMPRDLDSFRADPAVLQDELFCLFRLLPPGKGALIQPDDIDNAKHPESAKWSLAAAMPQLIADGLVDRTRLLSASLEALQVGRRPNDVAWFYRFT